MSIPDIFSFSQNSSNSLCSLPRIDYPFTSQLIRAVLPVKLHHLYMTQPGVLVGSLNLTCWWWTNILSLQDIQEILEEEVLKFNDASHIHDRLTFQEKEMTGIIIERDLTRESSCEQLSYGTVVFAKWLSSLNPLYPVCYCFPLWYHFVSLW